MSPTSMMVAPDPKGDARRRNLATLRAKLALKGFDVRQLASGCWLVSKSSLPREGGGTGTDAIEVSASQVDAHRQVVLEVIKGASE